MDLKNIENIITSIKSNEHSIKPKKSKEKCYYCNKKLKMMQNHHVDVIINFLNPSNLQSHNCYF